MCELFHRYNNFLIMIYNSNFVTKITDNRTDLTTVVHDGYIKQYCKTNTVPEGTGAARVK